MRALLEQLMERRDLAESQAAELLQGLISAEVPDVMKGAVLAALRTNTAKAVEFLEKHPKALLTAAAVTAFVVSKDELLGLNGQPGMIERLTKEPIRVVGFVLAGLSPNIWLFALAHGLLMGVFGSSSTFAPLLADTSMWWDKRRGIAVAVCASGNYVAGSIWPALAQQGVEALGWRETYVWIGVVCGVGMLALSFLMRQRPPLMATSAPGSVQQLASEKPFGLSINTAHALLCVAGVACCVAMAMPQVHIVAYCTDLGFGAARGSEMLSLMLACGIVSRLVSGAICDRIGGLRTLVLGSVLQGVALLMFLPFDGMVSLYVISALFGLFQGGIVPSYAIIVREYFPAQKVGVLVGAVIMATMIGMALGGWMSGKVFDLTGSYHAAFINGVLWNALNLSIAVFLLWRTQIKKKA